MNAMHFAWTILKNDPDFETMQYLNMSPAQLSELEPAEKQHAFSLIQAYLSRAEEPIGEMDEMTPSQMDDEDFPAAPEWSSTGQGYSTTKPSIPYPFEEEDNVRASMEFLRKYDPSIYGRAGRASPYVADGRSRPVSPEQRIAQQGRAMEQQDATESDRNRLMQEMQAAGMTQESMGALPFQDLMRQSKTPQGAAMIRQMIRQRPPMAEVPGEGTRDKLQLSEPMSAIDAAWAVLKSM